MFMFGRDGGRLLPLAKESIVDQGLIGTDGRGIGSVATCSSGTDAAALRV